MVSNYCTSCDIGWFPYQTPKGHCPDCGSGTVIRQEAASPESVERYRAATDAGRRAQLHADFETYYRVREAERLAAGESWRQAA